MIYVKELAANDVAYNDGGAQVEFPKKQFGNLWNSGDVTISVKYNKDGVWSETSTVLTIPDQGNFYAREYSKRNGDRSPLKEFFEKVLKLKPSDIGSLLIFEDIDGDGLNFELFLYKPKSKKTQLQTSFSISPRQRILYGAPGTGKSHGIKEKEGGFSKVIRTTFHPDSDYSTFVGAYKPTMASKERIYSADELIGKLTTIKESGVSYPCHKFSAQYWESLKDLPAAEIKRIVTACGFTDSMTVEVGKGVSIGQELASKSDDKKITYSFVKQAFLKAYIEAWKRHNKRENVLLVIEEINRGNCAQIFGDLFQLLDRNDEGYSDYPIQADEDIRMVLADEFVNLENIPENVKSGEELLLPNNLYIWATMNTSDQSLFPIDSAFKRRWDWEYVPIDTKKENWTIKTASNEYSWSSFLEKINEEIDSTTHSEDKMLGFYFCRANSGVIDADKFVSKVLFYIYNDVFKDYGFDREMFKDGDGKVMSFKSYYKTDGSINENMVLKFLDNLKVEKNTIEDNANNDPNIKTE